MEFGEERLAEQDDGGERDDDESEALRRERAQQPQGFKASGKRGADPEEKKEKAGGEQ